MPFNAAGNLAALNAANQLSLHSSNPGTGSTPAAGELSGAPYARKACVFNAPVANGVAAESSLNANVVFDLNTAADQNVQFVGLWNGSTYLGYFVPDPVYNFTGTGITTRQYTLTTANTKLIRTNA